ncbi:DUF1772 domain-containing protein [Plantactinospora sonchi]|uniref:DUF1772 domain-containing protein n=1 Tax=Plantactinospora sonchi TaxID=1544735 RepID=A0ABU7RUA5_9ACTN
MGTSAERVRTPRAERTRRAGSGADPRSRATAVRIVRALALMSTGLLAGAFCYGALNVVQAFQAVPLDVRLTFHSALMRMNGPVMQSAMGVAVLSSLVLAILLRGTPRRLAGAASALVVTTFVVTRFGNVPINRQMRDWLTTSPSADHAAILSRWEMLNYIRSFTALAAFILVLMVVDRALTRADGTAYPVEGA